MATSVCRAASTVHRKKVGTVKQRRVEGRQLTLVGLRGGHVGNKGGHQILSAGTLYHQLRRVGSRNPLDRTWGHAPCALYGVSLSSVTDLCCGPANSEYSSWYKL